MSWLHVCHDCVKRRGSHYYCTIGWLCEKPMPCDACGQIMPVTPPTNSCDYGESISPSEIGEFSCVALDLSTERLRDGMPIMALRGDLCLDFARGLLEELSKKQPVVRMVLTLKVGGQNWYWRRS